MRRQSLFFIAFCCSIVIVFGCNQKGSDPNTSGPGPGPAAVTGPPPKLEAKVKLAVLVVFDQMRGDYLAKWKPLFGSGGFTRLQNEGAWFEHCYYPYEIGRAHV